MIRLRPMREILTLDSCIPEICLINAHDGSSAYLMLIFVCHHRRDSTCYPAYLQLNPRRGAMVTFSEELTVRNGKAGALDRLILRHRSRRQGAPLHTRWALMPEPVNVWIDAHPNSGERLVSGNSIRAYYLRTSRDNMLLSDFPDRTPVITSPWCRRL